MEKSASIVNMVFSTIDNVVSTVETIHGDIAGITREKSGNESGIAEKRKNVYGVIKSINDSVGNLVDNFFKQRTGSK